MGLLYNFYKKTEIEFSKKYSLLKNEYKLVEDVLTNNLLNSNSYIGFEFNNKIILEDTALNKISLINVIKSGNILVYRISDTHCSSCDIAGLKSLVSPNVKIPKDRIIVIGSFYNTKLLASYVFENNIVHKAYNLKQSINIRAEEFNFPYFIVVNKDLEVLSCFFPEKSKPYLTEYYLLGIKHLFDN